MLKRFLKITGDNELLSAERVMVVAIAVLIISLLAAQVAHMRSVNRDNIRKSDLYSIQLSLQKYYALNGHYPHSLTQLTNLAAKTCSDPITGGDCADSAYSYKAFVSGMPSVNSKPNCDKHRPICVSYVLYSSHMETTANPYTLTSY